MIAGSVAIVCGQNSLLGAGLCALLRDNVGFSSAHHVTSHRELMNKLAKSRFVRFLAIDLATPDLRDPNCIRELRVNYPGLYLAAIGGSLNRNEILFALSAGVHGYIPSSASFDMIVSSIEAIVSGQIYVPKEIADLEVEPLEQANTNVPRMTGREREVMNLLAKGHSNKKIALALNLSEGTVKVHVRSGYRKLGVGNRTSAAAALAQMRMTHIPTSLQRHDHMRLPSQENWRVG
jgi:DNA-binding NarL/FixJ family response regulator